MQPYLALEVHEHLKKTGYLNTRRHNVAYSHAVLILFPVHILLVTDGFRVGESALSSSAYCIAQCPLGSERKQLGLSTSQVNCNEVFHSVSHLKATMENIVEGVEWIFHWLS